MMKDGLYRDEIRNDIIQVTNKRHPQSLLYQIGEQALFGRPTAVLPPLDVRKRPCPLDAPAPPVII